jgi:hypothetical protein
MYSALDRLESFRKVADGKVITEASTTFVALPVAFTSSISVRRSLILWGISRELVGGDVLRVFVLSRA